MGKKKTNTMTISQVKTLIDEVKKKCKPDFLSVKTTNNSEVEISFGWKITGGKKK